MADIGNDTCRNVSGSAPGQVPAARGWDIAVTLGSGLFSGVLGCLRYFGALVSPWAWFLYWVVPILLVTFLCLYTAWNWLCLSLFFAWHGSGFQSTLCENSVLQHIPKPAWVCTPGSTRGWTATGQPGQRSYVISTPEFPRFDGPYLRRSPLLLGNTPHENTPYEEGRSPTGSHFLEQLDRALDRLLHDIQSDQRSIVSFLQKIERNPINTRFRSPLPFAHLWPSSVVDHFGSENPLQRRIGQLEAIIETRIESRAAFRKVLAEHAGDVETLRTMSRSISPASREAQKDFSVETSKLQQAIMATEEELKSGGARGNRRAELIMLTEQVEDTEAVWRKSRVSYSDMSNTIEVERLASRSFKDIEKSMNGEIDRCTDILAQLRPLKEEASRPNWWFKVNGEEITAEEERLMAIGHDLLEILGETYRKHHY